MEEVITKDAHTKSALKKEDFKADPTLKGGYFIIGDSPASKVFITEELDEEQHMIANLVRDFCIKEVQEPFFSTGRELEVTNEADKSKVLAMLKRAGKLGLCGVSIPTTYGGMGLDFKTNTFISSVLSNGFSFATTLGAQTSIGCLPLVYYGTEAQKNKYLPKIATAEYVAAYALTEPEAGSDANSGKTVATLTPDGRHYLLNGQKIWITNGGFADLFTVFAKIDGDKYLSAFIVERQFEGFSVGAEEKKLGIKGSSTVPIFFDNCRVPVENLLGEREGGFKMALNILNGGRIKAGAGGLGGTKNALNKAITHTTQRKQFNRTLASFGAIQYKIGHIAMQIFANEAAIFRTADLIDRKEAELSARGMVSHKAKISAIREFAIEAAIVKVKGSELVCQAVDEVIQMHGGMGYAAETGLGMGLRDARITKIYEGTNDINSMLAVGELSKRGFVHKEVDLPAAIKKVPGFIFRQWIPFRPGAAYPKERRIVEGLKNAFLFLLGITGRKLGKKMIEEQEIILNMSAILQEAYVAESALLKVEKLELKNWDPEKLAVQKLMLQLYLYEASSIAKKAGTEAIMSLFSGNSKKLYKKLLQLILGQYNINPKDIRRKIAQYMINQGKYPF